MSITIDGITLPSTLIFEDEFKRSQEQLQKEMSLDGRLIAEPSTLITGLPITLRGGSNHAWVKRPFMVALRANADTPGEKVLDFHGTEYAVIWDHDRGAIEATQFRPYGVTNDDMKYRNLVLRFLEI